DLVRPYHRQAVGREQEPSEQVAPARTATALGLPRLGHGHLHEALSVLCGDQRLVRVALDHPFLARLEALGGHAAVAVLVPNSVTRINKRVALDRNQRTHRLADLRLRRGDRAWETFQARIEIGLHLRLS